MPAPMADLPSEPVQPVVVDERGRAAGDGDAVLFTPFQIAVAALFGTPIAAGLFWFFNTRALHRRHASLAFVAGAALTLGPFAAGTYLQRELFGVAVLVLWPLGYGVTASLRFPQRRARSWAVVVAVSLGVVVFLMQTEAWLNVRGAVVPRPPVGAVATAGNVYVNFEEGDVDVDDATAVAAALDDAGVGKEGLLRLHMTNAVGTEPVLQLAVPRGGDDVVEAGKAVAHIAAGALGGCLRLRLLLPNGAEVASGRACSPRH